MSGDPQDFITIAKVLKTQGRNGEVAAELFTDFPERFEQRHKLSAMLEDGKRRELQLEQYWPHKGRMIFKFAGIDSISDAETLLGSELQVARAERTELEPGAVYVSDLVGCHVIATSGNEKNDLGPIAEVEFSTGTAPLLVIDSERDGGKRELLIPFAEEFLTNRGVDLAAREVEMVLPEGMLELDAPLSWDEKQRQTSESQEASSSGERKRRKKR